MSGAKSGRLRLDRKTVVVIDEIGLLGTRQLNDILAAQKKDGLAFRRAEPCDDCFPFLSGISRNARRSRRPKWA